MCARNSQAKDEEENEEVVELPLITSTRESIRVGSLDMPMLLMADIDESPMTTTAGAPSISASIEVTSVVINLDRGTKPCERRPVQPRFLPRLRSHPL